MQKLSRRNKRYLVYMLSYFSIIYGSFLLISLNRVEIREITEIDFQISTFGFTVETNKNELNYCQRNDLKSRVTVNNTTNITLSKKEFVSFLNF